MMRKKYLKPVMDVRRFEEAIVTDGTGPVVYASVTAAQDVTVQAQNILSIKRFSGTVTAVKLESIMGFNN